MYDADNGKVLLSLWVTSIDCRTRGFVWFLSSGISRFQTYGFKMSRHDRVKTWNIKKAAFFLCFSFLLGERSGKGRGFGGTCFVPGIELATLRFPCGIKLSFSLLLVWKILEVTQLISLIIICFFMRICHLLKRKPVPIWFLEHHQKSCSQTWQPQNSSSTSSPPSQDSPRPVLGGGHCFQLIILQELMLILKRTDAPFPVLARKM